MTNFEALKGITISKGTHRFYDLITSFVAICKDDKFKGEIPKDAINEEGHGFWESVDAMFLLEDLFEYLDSNAPENYYFGTHYMDGSDFGFWQNEKY